jgi:hypothetical protein
VKLGGQKSGQKGGQKSGQKTIKFRKNLGTKWFIHEAFNPPKSLTEQ